SDADVVHWQKKRSRTAIPPWVCRDYIEYCHWYKKMWIQLSKNWIKTQEFPNILYFEDNGYKSLRAYTSTEDFILKSEISNNCWYSPDENLTIDIPVDFISKIEMLRILPLVKHEPSVPKVLWTHILSFATEPYDDC